MFSWCLNISFKPEIQKQSTLSGCHGANSISVKSPTFILYHLCHAQVLHYLIHPPQPPPPSQSFATYTGTIPSAYGSSPSKFRTSCCPWLIRTTLMIWHPFPLGSFRKKIPMCGCLSWCPVRSTHHSCAQHRRWPRTAREVTIHSTGGDHTCSVQPHLGGGCRTSDTSQGRGSCTIRPLHKCQKNLHSSTQVKGGQLRVTLFPNIKPATHPAD